MKKLFFISVIFTLSACSTNEKEVVNNLNSINIIPKPMSIEMGNDLLALDQDIYIVANNTDELNVARFLQTYLNNQGIKTTQDGKIRLELEIGQKNFENQEGYELDINENGISISAAKGAGLFYGAQSLIQIMTDNSSALPYIHIYDAPRFAYRGMHLDVGRHMFSVGDVKRYIDLMAHFKYNNFHWHLTEDQGWRIDIEKYPLLREVAAHRKATAIGKQSSSTRNEATYDGKPYGGYYSQDEIKEVIEYAHQRYINIVPEIELPGHSVAALAAYPHLGCTGGPYETATSWGVYDDIYCAGKESTFEFLEGVLDEVITLFPGKYIHIGGDEAPKTKWEQCEHCQKRIKDEGLADEHELQSYFIQRIEKFLNQKGKTIIGWDEILEGGLAENAIVMSWRGEEGGISAAKQHHEVIMTPVDWCYFDYYQADPANEPLAIGGMITLEKVYGYEPVPKELSPEEAKYIIGSQCNLWSEYINTMDYLEYMAYPRAIALSEVLWTPANSKNYDDFMRRLIGLKPLLDQMKINYAKHHLAEKIIKRD